MDKGKRNITLVYERDKNGQVQTSLEKAAPVIARPNLDYPVAGYEIAFAMNGGYVVTVTYEGTSQKDFLTFLTKDDLIDALKICIK